MDGLDRDVGTLLNASSVYEIPPYQRNYEWDESRWQGMVSDVIQAATRSANDPAHWLGIILLTRAEEPRFPGDRSVAQYTVIDRQQRMVTLIVWIAALADHAVDQGGRAPIDVSKLSRIFVQKSDEPSFEVATSNKWRDPKFRQLLSVPTSPLGAYRYFRWVLWLGEDALLREDPVPMPKYVRPEPGEAFEAHWARITGTTRGKQLPRGNPCDVDALVDATLQRLSVHTLLHNPRTDETAAVVFDSLNGDRTELQPMDHVRNSLFIRITPRAAADRLYENEWEPHETALRRVQMKRTSSASLFLYDYVISKGERKRQKTINANRGAAHFAVMTRNLSSTAALEKFVRDSFLPAMATWPVVVRRQDSVLLNGVPTSFPARALDLMTSIQELSSNPANPVVLHYATAHVMGKIGDAELETVLFLTESYLARQLLVGRPLSPLRSKLMDVMGRIDGDITEKSLVAALSAVDWVSDREVTAGSRDRAYYGDLSPRKLGALFRGIERSLSGGGSMNFHLGAASDDYTIEHLFPQDPKKWVADISKWRGNPTAMRDQLHTLGNLTVVTNKHNRRVGNDTFAKKKAFPTVPGNAAPLSLNKDWTVSRKWTDRDIARRTTRLIGEALAYWKTP